MFRAHLFESCKRRVYIVIYLIIFVSLRNSRGDLNTPALMLDISSHITPATWRRIRHFLASLVCDSLTATVYNPKAKHSCSVVGCTDTHISLHRLHTKEDIRAKWLKKFFQGNVTASVSKSVVCANHFTPECFSNQGQHQAGLATRLFLTLTGDVNMRLS